MKFIINKREVSQIPFLDTFLKLEGDVTVTTKIYTKRKPIRTTIYILTQVITHTAKVRYCVDPKDQNGYHN